MGILQTIFRKKEKEVEDATVEEICDLPGVEIDLICSKCNMVIHPGQRVKILAGEKMHMKPCFLKLNKKTKASI